MTLEEYKVPYMTEETPLPITEQRFKKIKEALKTHKETSKRGHGKYYFKHEICTDLKLSRWTLRRIEISPSFKKYQSIWRKKS